MDRRRRRRGGGEKPKQEEEIEVEAAGGGEGEGKEEWVCNFAFVKPRGMELSIRKEGGTKTVCAFATVLISSFLQS